MHPWKSILLTAVLALSILAACEDQKDTRNVSSTSSDDATTEHLATAPVPVTGSYLRCSYVDESTSSVGCNPYDANQNMIDLDVFGTDVRWSYESSLTVTFTKNSVDKNNVRWQGRFDFAAGSEVDRLTQILETKISLSFVRKDSNQTVTLQDKIRNLLIELSEHRFIKIAYTSLHMNPPAQTTVLPDVVDFEFKINGVWEKVTIRVDTLNFAAHTMMSDRFAFQLVGSDADWKMLLTSSMGKDLATLFANNLDALSWKTASGNSWIFDASSSFKSAEPYDLKETTKPVELIIDLGQKKRFHGFRLDGGQANPGRQLPNGFPDNFYFLYSDDNKTWTKIQGSESTLEGRNLLEWSWDP